jgi:predicted house-cleaning noncanonical NTP pyrophosphatase (MazG superfamily)
MSGLTPAPDGYPIKLVRDHSPQILNPGGFAGKLWYRPAKEEEISRFLRLKLAEEVGEFLVDGGADELADVLAVVWSISDREGWNLYKILDDDPRGLFSDPQMMVGHHEEFDNS